MKIKSLLAVAAASLAFTACVDDGGNEYHSTSFYPMTSSGIQCFADQTVDSVRVISYDSWSLTNSCPWMEISENGRPAPFTVKIPAGFSSSNRLDLKLQPNTTGMMRRTQIDVVSSFDKIGTVSQTLTQYPYHNVIWPNVKSVTENGNTTYNFTLNVDAAGTTGDEIKNCLKIKLFSADATLTSAESWVRPKKTEGFETAKLEVVPLAIDRNSTDAERTAVLTFSSLGIKTQIKVVQAKAGK